MKGLEAVIKDMIFPNLDFISFRGNSTLTTHFIKVSLKPFYYKGFRNSNY